jgi:hypothetical protein
MKKKFGMLFFLIILVSTIVFSAPYQLHSSLLDPTSESYILDKIGFYATSIAQIIGNPRPLVSIEEVHSAEIGVIPDFGYHLNVYSRPVVDTYLSNLLKDYLAALSFLDNPFSAPDSSPDYWGIIMGFRKSNQYLEKVYVKVTAFSDNRVIEALQNHMQKLFSSSIPKDFTTILMFFQIHDLKKENSLLNLGGNFGKVLTGRIDYGIMYFNNAQTEKGFYFRTPIDFSIFDNRVGGLYLVF